jgi:hypothetical protein
MFETTRKRLENDAWDRKRKPWKSAVDPKTQKKYYYNTRTLQSAWFMPLMERQPGGLFCSAAARRTVLMPAMVVTCSVLTGLQLVLRDVHGERSAAVNVRLRCCTVCTVRGLGVWTPVVLYSRAQCSINEHDVLDPQTKAAILIQKVVRCV